ncbi:MAG: trehalose-phosphatase [Gammaproteobacteria bacterium]|nr:trehalose-phosphatase [Gammaproteobacteria bacterium]
MTPDRTLWDIDAFFVLLRRARRRVLMLDYDGTLAPFHINPARAVPYPGIKALLARLMAQAGTRLVIVSGRWIQDLVPLLGLEQLPEIWGSHGWERRQANGAYTGASLDLEMRKIFEEASAAVAVTEALGARIERKPTCLAVHWRGLPAVTTHRIKDRVCENWTRMASDERVVWHEFDGGIELRLAGFDKGSVVQEILREEGTEAACAYLGDDHTDEAAFAAMPDEGAAVLVHPYYRVTAAHYWIRPPSGVRRFLPRWIEAGAR